MIEQCEMCGAKQNESRFYPKLRLCHKCYMKIYRQQHSKEISQYNRQYFLAHRSQIYDNNKKRYKNNPQSKREADKKYYLSHRRECIRKNNECQSLRKAKDPIFRFKMSIRHTIYLAVTTRSKHSSSKSKKTEEILGCTLDYFMRYIEKQFKTGMTWDNYGEWHLDHIRPLISGKTQEEVYKLNHYTNFQPLWAEDNLRKGGKIE